MNGSSDLADHRVTSQPKASPLFSSTSMEDESRPAVSKTAKAPRGPSIWKKVVNKLGLKLELPILIMMAKGAVAPTIGLAIYQNATVAAHYSSIGYLIPMMSVLSVPIMPRSRYIQNLLVTLVLVCLGAAFSLLAMWCAVKARENTTHIPPASLGHGPVPGTRVAPFNAAASANMGVWLFFWVWIINTFRAYRPQYFLPSIVVSIFINITATYGTQFATMEQAEALVRRLLDSFCAGFAISAATSFFVIPFTSRDIVSMLMKAQLHEYKTVLEAQSQFILSLPGRDWYGSKTSFRDLNSGGELENAAENCAPFPEADALKKATGMVSELQVKIQSELRYALRDFAWSKLGANDFETINHLLKDLLVPVLGTESLVQVTNRIEQRGGWEAVRTKDNHNLSESEMEALEETEKEQWRWIFEQLHGPVQKLQQAMAEGLEHFLYAMELTKLPKSAKADPEAKGLDSSPGGQGFAAHLERMIQEFLVQREGPLKEWCTSKGMDNYSRKNDSKPSDFPLHHRHQSQLYLILDLEYSFLTTARAILQLVKFADSKVEDGTMKRNHLILPGWKRMRHWIAAVFLREDSELDYQAYSTRSGTVTVYLGDTLLSQKDAEHLPPVTVWEKITNQLRHIPHFFGSSESTFGFRVAVGTMVIALPCFLRNSQHFFIEQRIIWGSIMVAISMTQTAGSGIYGQFLRFFGTFVAMAASFIDWYIVDQHTAGIIVFVGITMFLYHYLLVTVPENPVLPMIGMVTVLLIVGYELQVKQVGILISVSNGQIFHPLYEIAPYRLAAVAAGVGVACFFTYFPSVVTARAQLRKDLGSALYLLGHYYNSVHRTVSMRVRGMEGDPHDKNSPGRKLEKARSRVFAKQLVLIQGLKQHIKFTSWEPTFGGKFPRGPYERIINHTQNILQFTSMIAFVTESFQTLPSNVPNEAAETDKWTSDFKQLIVSLQLTSQEVTTLLSVVSAAIASGKPLPPYLVAPPAHDLTQLLESLDTDILSSKHVCEPGYATFAVMQVAITMLADDLAGLLKETRELVGEVDFNVNFLAVEYSEDGDGDTSTFEEEEVRAEGSKEKTR